ncbi:unnamed protein product [Thelazia callipaeda]|uniref:Fe_hyd_lg_C domain-containing protein n=1 Tax=Thelazia callipaeda TaxID=103827 RepID=A0A0N5CZS8_THECL|nr:unnamed protein product [Thelazia callipaeda]
MDNDSGGFSGVVKILNVDDFLVPSQACVLPLSGESDMKVGIKIKGQSKVAKKKVVVTLNDCLACSGCITSAETILVGEQSEARFLEGLMNSELSVLTVSPQSLASIAYKRGCQISEAAELVGKNFKSLGVRYVVDSSFGRQLTLSLSYDEFKKQHLKKPILTGVCPGFVCYAEKTHGELLIPHMSRVRSPQAVMGALVKDYLARKFDLKPEKIFHTAVMPCFDKKLEAARPHPLKFQYREVDCVLSTAEVDKLLSENSSFDFRPSNEAINWLNAIENGFVINTDGGSSGGYAEYVVERFITELNKPKVCHKSFLLVATEQSNNRHHFREKNLEIIDVFDGAEKLLTVAKCYGFRNIQNHVQKLKRSKCNYDYVEIMACPSGCINGVGQIRGVSEEGKKQILTLVESPSRSSSSESQQELEELKKEWSILNPDWTNLLYTQYQSVTNSVRGNIGSDW